MENIKFYVVTLLLVVGAGFLGYGAINSLRDPVYYVNNQTLTTVGDIKSGSNPESTPEIPTDTVAPTPSPETSPNTETGSPVTTITQPETPTQPTTTGSLATNAGIKFALQKIASGTVLKKGSTGDDVKALQAALNVVAKSGLPINGTFGAQTEAAVKKIPNLCKITIDRTGGE
jgi:hypothetical protein